MRDAGELVAERSNKAAAVCLCAIGITSDGMDLLGYRRGNDNCETK